MSNYIYTKDGELHKVDELQHGVRFDNFKKKVKKKVDEVKDAHSKYQSLSEAEKKFLNNPNEDTAAALNKANEEYDKTTSSKIDKKIRNTKEKVKEKILKYLKR